MELLKIHDTLNGSFFGNDSASLFENNLKLMPSDWMWRYTPVNYTLNNQKYRCPEWDTIDWGNSILLFGCSFTLGIGIDDTHTVAYKLQETLNLPVINLGAAGTSPMFHWVNSCKLVNYKINPRAVIYMWPHSSRTGMFVTENQMTNYGPWNSKGPVEALVMDLNHGTEFLRHAIYSTNAMWKCKVLHYHTDHDSVNAIPELKQLLLGPNDKARDELNGISHPGPLTHKYWSEVFETDLNGLW